jgi:L-2-hydroxyglutarate oxidase LhgO
VPSVDTIVVGAGVVGLAIARAEAIAGRDVLVLEAAERFGTATSSRNSEVLHAGIFHPSAMLKARLCVAGRRALVRYCVERGVPHCRSGKLLVATDAEEMTLLETYATRAAANGLTGAEALVPLSAAEARALEPELRCLTALSSPATTIVDVHALMRSLLADAEAHGAIVAYRSPVGRAVATPSGFRVTLDDGRGVAGPNAATTTVASRRLVNAAGLGAPELARCIDNYDPTRIPRQYLTKGSYFTFRGRSPFARPIYPPQRGGCSVHATIDLGGQLKFGPDAELVDRLDYAVDERRAARFYAAIRTYWPSLPDDGLQPGYAGIRPRLHAPGEPARDFVIEGPAAHGVAGLVQLFGIESPGLTACLAIAEHVGQLLERTSR